MVHAIRDVPLSRPSPQFDNAVLAAARKLPVEEATGKLRPRHYISAALLIAATLVVVVLAGSSGETQSQSMLSPVFEKITDVLSPLTEQFRTQSERIFPDVTARQSPVLKVFLLASIALLFIGSLDRFILPKMRHRGHPGQ